VDIGWLTTYETVAERTWKTDLRNSKGREGGDAVVAPDESGGVRLQREDRREDERNCGPHREQ